MYKEGSFYFIFENLIVIFTGLYTLFLYKIEVTFN